MTSTRFANPIAPLLASLAAAGGTWLVWRVFVATVTGQQADQLSFIGSEIGSWRIDEQGLDLLGVVSVSFVAAVIATVMIIALLRRQLMLAIEAAAVVAGANLSTQVLKYWLFTRADLIDLGAGLGTTNTMPSGHTTVAASAAVAAVLVVPVALRAVTAFAGTVVTVAFGYATMVNQWHRPSDVVSAVLVALAWGLLAVAIGRARQARRGTSRLLPYPAGRTSRFTTGLLALAGVAALVAAAIAVVMVQGVAPDAATRAQQFTAYLGGAAGLVAVTAGGLAVLLRLLDHSVIETPAPDPVSVDQGATFGGSQRKG